MKLIVRLLVAVAANLIGLLLAARFVGNVHLAGDFTALVTVAAALAALNLALKPLLKLLLGPVILVTLGLGTVLVNAIILFVLDFLFQNLSIVGIVPLIYASLTVSAVNLIFHAFTKD